MSGVLAALSRRADIVMAGGTAAGSAPEPGFPVPAATVIHSRMMIYRILLGIILAAALGGLCLSVLSHDMLWAVLMLAPPAAVLGGGMMLRAKGHVMAASVVLLLLALPAMALSLWMFFLWTMFTFGSGRVNWFRSISAGTYSPRRAAPLFVPIPSLTFFHNFSSANTPRLDPTVVVQVWND